MRRPFVIFLIMVLALVAGSVLFLQSRTFAGVVRGFLSRTVPRELGVSVGFTEFQLKVFPPGISVRDPELHLEERNFLGLSPDSVVKAGRLELRFRPFQMLWGDIRIEQVRLVDAEVSLDLSSRGPAPARGLRWSELIRVRLQSVAMERTRLRLRWPSEGIELVSLVEMAQLARIEDAGGSLFSLDAAAGDLDLRRRQVGHSLSSLALSADLGPEGIRVKSLQAVRKYGAESTTLRATGDVAGDLLNPRSLKAALQIEAAGDFDRLLALWLAPPKARSQRSIDPVSGTFSAKGKLSADLLRFEETAAFDGSVGLASGQLWGWSFQKAEAGLRVRSASGKGADIEVEAASITSPGQGVLSIGRSRFTVGPGGISDDVSIPVRLEEAPVSWLTGPYSSSVRGLEVLLSGDLAVDLRPARRWSLRARADLRAGGLKLVSSASSEGRSRNTILETRPSRLQGEFVVDSTHFAPEQLKWKFEQSALDLSGEVNWSAGAAHWGLKAAGPVNLSDLLELGHSRILGRGQMMASVHGPSDRIEIDFDADLADASYINLDFGSLKGRFSLVEDQKVLQLRGVAGRRGETPYTISGPIDFRGDGTLDLDVLFPGGRTEDFLAIFHPLTRDLSWFPQSLRGRLKASGKVHGGLGLSRLRVDTQIDGSDWALLGERFRSVRFSGGYDQGTYRMQGLEARKRTGTLLGGISFDSKGRFDWNFRSQGFSLRDLDWMLRLAIPVRGDIQVSSEGSGTLQSLESSTQVALTRTVIRSRTYPPSTLRLSSSAGVWKAVGSGLGDQVRFDWAHDPKPGSSNALSLAVNSADFSPVLLLLNPKSVQDLSLIGRATGSVELSYPGTSLDRANGSLVLSEFLARKEGALLQLAEPVSGRVVQGALSMPDIRILGERGSVARLSLASRDGEWRCSLTGESDLSALEFLTPLVQQSSGKADLDIELRGLLGAPQISGRVDIREGYVRTTALDSPLENLQGRVTIRSGRVMLSGVQADLAQGRASASGQIEFFTDRFPVIDLSAQLDENRLKIYPFQFLKLRTAKLKVTGSQLPYDVSGTVSVEQGLSREKLAGAGQGVALQSSLYAPPPTGDVVFDFPKFRLNIDVNADSGLKFQNELLDVEMRANVTVVNTIEAPRLLGRAELVPGQGRMTFKDHVFQVQSALVKFDNPAVLSPVFDLVATTEISGTKVQLYTSGTAERFKVELSSNPVLPEPEILSLLAMGRTLEESQRLRAGSTSGVQQSEAASLILQSLDFNRDVREKTGFQVGVGEAVDTAAGTSIFRPQGDLESSVAPKIVLKRQIGKRMDVSVGSTVGSGATNQREVNADFYISPSVSLRGVWNFFEGSTSQDTSTTTLQQSRTSYGVDLKLQKRFK